MTLSLLSYPFILLTVRGALWRLDPALEETARSLGKGTLATFREVILPQLRPAIAAGSLLVALYTLSDFGAVSLLRYETFTWAIYLQYESALDRTVAAALSLVLVGLALGVLVVEALTRPAHQYYRSGAGVARPGVSVRLGRWRWLALGWCAAIVLLALGLPVLNLGYWLVRGVLAGEPLVFLWSLARNSIYVSGLAAMATLLAAAPVVALTVRYSGLLTRWLERITYIGFALPGIVVALALVFFGANYAFPLYQTTGLLVLAYVVLFLPTALGPLRASLLQVRPSVEEAGRGLGRSPFGVLLAVTLPLMRPGVVAGAAPGLPGHDEGIAGHPDPQSHRLQHAGDIHLVGHFRGLLRSGGRAGLAADPRLFRTHGFPGSEGTEVAPMSGIAVRCVGLFKRYGNVQAAEAFDLEVPRGAVLALVGPSGGGKTTILRLIAGFETPDAGTVELNGRMVAGPGVHVPPEKRQAGMVFQDYALFPHLTVAENVAFGLAKNQEREARTGEALALVGLTGLEARRPHQLSGGQQQRVALARALAPGPHVLLLDEPFSNLHASLRLQVRQEVKDIPSGERHHSGFRHP